MKLYGSCREFAKRAYFRHLVVAVRNNTGTIRKQKLTATNGGYMRHVQCADIAFLALGEEKE